MNRDEMEIIFQDALALKKKRNNREALKLVETLLREGFGGQFFYSTTAHLYFLLKDYSHTLDMADAALHIYPGHQFTRKIKAMALHHLGRRDEAGHIFHELAATDPAPQTAKDIASFLVANGDHANAIAYLDRALASAPGNRELLLVKADVLKEAGREAEWEECYAKILEANPGDSFIYSKFIEEKLKPLSPEESIGELRNILSIPSKKSNIHLRKLLAKRLYGQKKYREAYEEYLDIHKEWPNDDFTRKQMGFSLVHLSEYEKAIPCLEECFSRDPDDFYVRSTLVNAYRKMGAENKGVLFFKGLLAKYPAMKNLWGAIRELSQKKDSAAGEAIKKSSSGKKKSL